MGIWTAVEQPGSRPRRSWLFDVAVALLALLASGAYVNAAPRLPLWQPLLIILGLALPLVVRRIWPVPVFGWMYLLAAATGWWAMQVVWSPALVIGLYTVAVLRPRRDALVAAGLLAAGTVVSWAHVFPDSGPLSAAPLLTVVVAVTILGFYIRTRRALFDQLRERAERLEVERDQQVALAAAAERTRIAREMHDVVAHHLTVMVTLAEGAAARIASTPEQAAEAMRAVSATGRLALNDTRQLLGVLRDRSAPGDPPRAPLADPAGLDELIDRVRTAGLPVRYEVEGAPPAGAPGAVLALYRIVQEALTNTMKHAGPGAGATVRVRYGPGDITVAVTDDGTGAGTIRAGAGKGLIGMRERVDAFGGEVHAGPREPTGWQVTARLRLAGERLTGERLTGERP